MPSTPLRHVGDKPEEEAPQLPLGRSLIAVIGIDKYADLEPLTNAANDAQAVLRVFKRCGFEELPEAPSLFNEQATLSALTSLVREQLPGALQPDDSLVLFYAGHGATTESKAPDPNDASKMQTRYTGYLIPVEARKQKPSNWLRLDTFLEDIANLPARHVLVILDACKSGFALSEKFKRRGEEQASGTIAQLSDRVSRRVITSATHEQTAMDGGGSGNSLFTDTLVDAVENLRADSDGDGYLSSTELFSYVRQQVGDTASRAHGVQQTPDYGYLPGDGSGELVLSLRGDTYNRLRAAETLKVADHIYQLGWWSSDRKRFASAIRHYNEALKLASLGKMPLPAARLGLGKALLAAGQVDQAASELAELVRGAGEAVPAEAQLYLGLAQAKRSEYAQAVKALQAWRRLHPESVDAAWVSAYVKWLGRASRGAAGQKLALLVGVNEYRLARFPGLNGCLNDVQKLMQPALVRHGGFRADEVTVVTDSQATRARFMQELQKLQKKATASDAVVVHFSGHSIPASAVDRIGSSYVNNMYLILHDTDDKPGHLTNGITAGELHQWMQDIPAQRKTLILDTHASEDLVELARREGSYALILASDTAEVAYEWHVDVAGEDVRCGMLTGALYQSLLGADGRTLTYGDWITAAIRIAEQASSQYRQLQTPYFSGIRSQRVFGHDDIYGSVFEFSQRQDWPDLSLDELTRLYSIFSHALTVPHPRGHSAFGRAFLNKGADAQAITALQTALTQRGDAEPANLVTLARAQFHAGDHASALATLQCYAPLSAPADRDAVEDLGGLLDKLTKARKHALLVGIDQYQSQQVAHLEGAHNDVAALKQALTQRWGFQADDIVELVDAKATRAAILAEFGRLADVARRESALFFFAGRGSRDPDSLPTIVPYDGRQGDVPDIALEELANLAGQAATNLVTILDTSFAGRGPQASTRTIEPDRRSPAAAARFATNDARLAYIRTLRLGAVTICEDLETF